MPFTFRMMKKFRGFLKTLPIRESNTSEKNRKRCESSLLLSYSCTAIPSMGRCCSLLPATNPALDVFIHLPTLPLYAHTLTQFCFFIFSSFGLSHQLFSSSCFFPGSTWDKGASDVAGRRGEQRKRQLPHPTSE